MECRRGLAMRILSVRTSVRLSVRPSVTRVNCDKTVERSVQEEHSAYFSEKKNGWWGRPLLPEILGQPALVRAKSPILNR